MAGTSAVWNRSKWRLEIGFGSGAQTRKRVTAMASEVSSKKSRTTRSPFVGPIDESSNSPVLDPLRSTTAR